MAQHCKLLQEDRTLRPWAAFGDGVAPILERGRLAISRPPIRHVCAAQQTGIALTAAIAHALVAIKGVDRSRLEPAGPEIVRSPAAARDAARRGRRYPPESGKNAG